MFLQPDGTLWVQLLNFALFYAILNVVFLRPVGKAIAARRAHIESVTADYDEFMRQLRGMRAEAEAKRAAARRDAENVLAEGRAATSNETAALAEHYAERVQRIVADARRTVSRESEAARSSESETVAELAGLMIERAFAGRQ